MSKMIELELGAMAPKIKEQMKKQKIKIDADVLDRLQRQADSITGLHISGLLTDSETNKVRHRFFAKLKKAIRS